MPIVQPSREYRVLGYDDALATSLIDKAPDWDERASYSSYLVAYENANPVELLLSDAWMPDAPEDVTLGRALSFLPELLAELGPRAGREFRVLKEDEAFACGLTSDPDDYGLYLVEIRAGGAPELLWAEKWAQWAPEDLSLGRDFSFIAPLLNELARF